MNRSSFQQKKIFVERLGCKLIPVQYMESMKDFVEARRTKFEERAWEELVAFIGTQGLNDTKYKSLKENLKEDFAKKQDNYPKTVKDIKPRIEYRTWDAAPKKKEKKSDSKLSDAKKKEYSEAGADTQANFYQKSVNKKQCHCCGSKGHFVPKCEKKG